MVCSTEKKKKKWIFVVVFFESIERHKVFSLLGYTAVYDTKVPQNGKSVLGREDPEDMEEIPMEAHS